MEWAEDIKKRETHTDTHVYLELWKDSKYNFDCRNKLHWYIYMSPAII